MIINRIKPQGYCGGVVHALKIVNEILDDPNTIRPIYLLGNTIHNRHVASELEKKGAIIIADETKTRLELLDQISAGTVVFSAHGVAPSVYEKARKKGLNIVDSTCPNVIIVQKRIKEYLNKNYEIIYIGTKKHPECEAILGISKKIHFVTNLADIEDLTLDNRGIYVTNQTTLSIYDIKEIFNRIKIKYPMANIDDNICDATTVRQEALAKQKKVDLCIVVGDKASSNTKKLVLVSQNIAKIPTIFCEDLASLDKKLVKTAQSISITSGASTPEFIVDEIIEYLEKING